MASADDDERLRPSSTRAAGATPRAPGDPRTSPRNEADAGSDAQSSALNEGPMRSEVGSERGQREDGQDARPGTGRQPGMASASGGGTTAPMPSIPKGGGAIRGIGEKFSANPVTGTASFQIPVATSPGRTGFHPELALSYDSGAGNGPFGHGFSLSVPHITRRTDRGLPTWRDNVDMDVFILSGAEDLVPKLVHDASTDTWSKEKFTDPDTNEVVTRYAPRIEGAFVRIEKREPLSGGGAYWQATTHDNVTSIYGKTDGARIKHPTYPFIFTWLLEETRDDKGNVILYTYKAEDLVNVPQDVPWERAHHKGLAPFANAHLKRIQYGNTIAPDGTNDDDVSASCLFEVVFDYGEHDATAPTLDESVTWPVRQDPFSSHRAGFEMRTYRLCRRVLVFHKMSELGSEPCLVASTDLTYSESPILTQLVAATHSGYIRQDDGSYTKKSHPPVALAYSEPTLDTSVKILSRKDIPDLPSGVHGPYQWVDLDGEGLPGVLTQQGPEILYKQNLGGGQLALARTLMTRPGGARLDSPGQQIADLDGDGEKELVFFNPPVAGYHDRTDGTWGPFVPFRSQPIFDWADPNVRFLDVTGDGLEDIVVTWYNEQILWFQSLGRDGYSAPAVYAKRSADDTAPGPQLVFADEVQTIFLADMTGDGLTDLVRVVNGNVSYWPNQGKGHFGAKVQMGGTSLFDLPDRFDPKRIRFADVDGTGTADILYIHATGIHLYKNQSGNSFAAPIELGAFPDHSPLSTISTVDLLGTGTACLVWSTSLPGHAQAPMRYMDLLGSTKPYLLTSIDNNRGLTTTLSYVPSTQLYREDAVAGTPWVTKLPFPVQTLAQVETYDAVSRHRFVTVYKYHHGYYDGVEREFRGFGMVEQWDTESFSRFSGTGDLPPPANASDPELHLPPVYTKTWFHTGAWKAGAAIARQYAHEYYAADTLAPEMPDCVVPSGLTPDELREATRALKGQMLRQEVYAQDGTADAEHPYLVTDKSYEVRQLQPVTVIPSKGLGSTRRIIHGVFLAYPREAIELHYERNPADPRITHAFTLSVDDFGVVTRSAAVGYPRRIAQNTVPYSEQAQLAITLTEVDVFHHPTPGASGWYRIGVPITTRVYELKGPTPPTDGVFSFATMLAAADDADAAAELPYEATPPTTGTTKRILSHAKTLYRSDDQATVLALGSVESLALPDKTYTKAFTPDLLSSALGGRATDTILAEGGYVQFSGDTTWWVQSGRQHFDAAHFYLPDTFYDPFDNATAVTYDGYNLLATGVQDPIGNSVSATYDYRVLAPNLVTDPNGNRVAAKFDELGMVVATAVMGKSGGSDGDTLDDPTTTFEYDLDRFRTSGKPTMVHARAREVHQDPSTRWQESYSYSDGSGHEVLRKVLAEPGQAPERDGSGALVHDESGALVFADANPRWVGTGRTVLDNKGNPVKQYEPFFDSTYEYVDETELVEWGVTPILRYDPLGRLVRTDLPNGSFTTVEFDPWKEVHYDPNDTVLDPADPTNTAKQSLWYQERVGLPTTDPEKRAADKAAAHAGTPGIVHLDSLGRTFLTIEDNGSAGQYATSLVLDIEGNALVVVDARGVHAQESTFGMGKRKLYQKSPDAGERWMLSDVAGTLLRAWDGRGFTRRATYDANRRATHLYVTPSGSSEMLVARTVYGEALATPDALNHRGRVYQHYDGAGVVKNVSFDFKGNLLEADRRLATTYTATVDWIALASLTDPTDIASAAESSLETETFATVTAYDALNRPTSITTPDTSEIRPTYNEAALLEKVDVRIRGASTWTPFVVDLDYNAKGQREQIVMGGDTSGANQTTTTYAYDAQTFRLTQLKTTRASDSAILQNLQYTYDPVGNITEIKDSAQQTVFFDNDVVLPVMAYVYDAIYRLIEGKGRELAGGLADVQRDQNDLPLQNLPLANDTSAVRNYTEDYTYDAVGNILSMAHDSGDPATRWTRHYAYEIDSSSNPVSNRLVGTSLPGDGSGVYSATYAYDAHGNMASMPHLASITWDHRDQMVSADLGGGGTVYFTYDAVGQRVRKVWVHSGLIEERIYLGGYEVYRKRTASDGTLTLERQTLHVMDGVKRVALVETTTVDADAGGSFTPTTVTRFQLGNNLGSAVLEVDETGAAISYEEYHPYGTSSYKSGTGAAEVSLKRYRYTGKERDEETGLYYHGARYYAPWLGRWAAADPIGITGGLNLFAYVNNKPVTLIDPTGTDNTTPPDSKKTRSVGFYIDVLFMVAASPATKKGAERLKDDAEILFGSNGMLAKFAQRDKSLQFLHRAAGIPVRPYVPVTEDEHKRMGAAIGDFASLTFPGLEGVELNIPGPPSLLAPAEGGVVSVLGSGLSKSIAVDSGVAKAQGLLLNAIIKGAPGSSKPPDEEKTSSEQPDKEAPAKKSEEATPAKSPAASGGSSTAKGLIGISDKVTSKYVKQLSKLEQDGTPLIREIHAFGSRAGSTYRGRGPTPTSDLDLLLVIDPKIMADKQAKMLGSWKVDAVLQQFEKEAGVPFQVVYEKSTTSFVEHNGMPVDTVFKRLFTR